MTSQQAAKEKDSPKLRILYHHRVGSKDGQDVHIESLAAALRNKHHKVAIVAPPAFARADFGGQSHSLIWLRRGASTVSI